jgi:hypothetical protein
MLTSGLLQISLAIEKQRAGGHLFRENEVWNVLKYLKLLFGTLVPTVSKSEGHLIKSF